MTCPQCQSTSSTCPNCVNPEPQHWYNADRIFVNWLLNVAQDRDCSEADQQRGHELLAECRRVRGLK